MDKKIWQALPENWKTGIRKYAEFSGDPKPKDFKKIDTLEKLFITIEENNLQPLEYFTGLKFFGIYKMDESLDLSPITVLKQVQYISLDGRVKDVSPLSKIKSLQKLDLYETHVSSLASFEKLKQIEKLDLYGSGVSDLKPLSGLKSLKTLRLGNCPDVSDIQPLATLPKLESLDLSHTGVVDLSPVKKMKKLKRLYLEGMDVSGSPAPRKIKAQIQAFEKSRPNLYISTAD
ncbi:MAG: hypothetical protein HY042_09910 [Spirochaetia bacterium]|nr:hypothetical protein [Spirochaetia bacterium]